MVDLLKLLGHQRFRLMRLCIDMVRSIGRLREEAVQQFDELFLNRGVGFVDGVNDHGAPVG
jgi:hypothetical protein